MICWFINYIILYNAHVFSKGNCSKGAWFKCVDGMPANWSHVPGFAAMKALQKLRSKACPKRARKADRGYPGTFSSCWPGYIDPESHLVDTDLPTLSGRVYVYVNLRDGICDYYYYNYIYIYLCECLCVLRIVIRSVWSFIWMLVMRRHGGTHLNSPILQGSVSKFARFEHVWAFCFHIHVHRVNSMCSCVLVYSS